MWTEGFDGVVDELRMDGRILELDRERMEERKQAAELRADAAARRPWMSAERMSQTEVSLRLAIHLIDRSLAAAEVVVALTGHELTRSNSPRFDVEAFLDARGFQSAGRRGDWRVPYRRTGRPRDPAAAMVLHNRIGEGDVVTRLADGRRFIAEVSGGPITPSRSPAEHRLFRGVIGRALTTECAIPNDVICAVVPRSSRFRALAQQWREAQRVTASGIRLVTIDRAGTVHGI